MPTMEVEISDPDNVKDLKITFDEDAAEIQVRFVRTNQQIDSEVKSEIRVSYMSGYMDEEGILYNGESRVIETYEIYQVMAP